MPALSARAWPPPQPRISDDLFSTTPTASMSNIRSMAIVRRTLDREGAVGSVTTRAPTSLSSMKAPSSPPTWSRAFNSVNPLGGMSSSK